MTPRIRYRVGDSPKLHKSQSECWKFEPNPQCPSEKTKFLRQISTATPCLELLTDDQEYSIFVTLSKDKNIYHHPSTIVDATLITILITIPLHFIQLTGQRGTHHSRSPIYWSPERSTNRITWIIYSVASIKIRPSMHTAILEVCFPHIESIYYFNSDIKLTSLLRRYLSMQA